ncbi:Fc receptor-like protein 5 [Collichthys lucidus]|uniref:Fc receptor-like protein 5 n=1 Tax=Collichthys lucidus TaxID=240159 RepID=A0A4U5VW47_COLLU|nr:Fc receptor-like protein 5 [Collichthys lucidus]
MTLTNNTQLRIRGQSMVGFCIRCPVTPRYDHLVLASFNAKKKISSKAEKQSDVAVLDERMSLLCLLGLFSVIYLMFLEHLTSGLLVHAAVQRLRAQRETSFPIQRRSQPGVFPRQEEKDRRNVFRQKEHEPEESSVYANMKTGTEDDNLMYAQVNCHNKSKASKNKGKSRPAATDETVYSEVKVGSAPDAELTYEPNSPYLFTGESVTFKCGMGEGNDTDWHYKFNRNGQQIVSFSTKNTHSLNLTADLSGDYQCIGRHKGSEKDEKESNSVTLYVSGSTGWEYGWFRRSSDFHNSKHLIDGNSSIISVSQKGMYCCYGRRGNPVFSTEDSDMFRVEMTLSNRIFVTRQQNWTRIYSGETVDVRCEIEGGEDTEWEYEWRTTSSNTPPAHSEYKIKSASHSGSYWCKGRRDLYSSTEWSEAFSLTVLSYRPKPTVTADRRIIPDGTNETLTCYLDNSAEWKYYWFRRRSVLSESEIIRDGEPDRVISISEGGIYHCRGGRGTPVYFTEDSDAVTIEKRVSSKPVVSLHPNWPLIFSGEAITIKCRIHEDTITEWEYEWSKPNSDTSPADDEYRISNAIVSNSGNYKCVGKHKWDTYSSSEWSDVVTLIVSSNRPKAELSAGDRDIPVGGSVTLTCSVKTSSSGWKYFWYRGEKTSEPLNTQDVLLSTGQIRVSQEGVYWCRGGRGEPVYYTEYSYSISINKSGTNRAVVTLQPNWSKIFSGETITLRCEIKNGGDTEWEYEWITTSLEKPSNQNEVSIRSASRYHSGQYWCKGRKKRAEQNSTGWSNAFQLTVSYKPLPVLTVSPLWLNAGDSVPLNCEVEHPSAGWRFYWYKAVPKLPGMYIPYNYGYWYHRYLDINRMDSRRLYTDSYSYELLSGSNNGTEQDSYIIHGQTHTAGYVCRAGRGDPVYYTQYSQPKFVWSADFNSQASLTVSPDRVQHFTYDSVSLNCEGNSTEWRVMFLENYRSSVSHCSTLGTMTGSTCHMDGQQLRNTVFWCESGSGEFSNAVNISIHYSVILVSPVHPVTEGDSVTLGCMLRSGQLFSNVIFYKNDNVIQNNDRAELNISAVSKSDEGFYGCEYSGRKSLNSWISVKYPEENHLIYLIAGGAGAAFIVIVLVIAVVFCYCRQNQAAGSDVNDLTVYADINEVASVDDPESVTKPCSVYETIDNRVTTVTPGPQTVYDKIQLSRVRKASVSPYQEIS